MDFIYSQLADSSDNSIENKILIPATLEAIKAQAKGEAEALKAQKEQITCELLQLRTIEMLKEKWDRHLPESYFGGSAPLPIVGCVQKQKQIADRDSTVERRPSPSPHGKQ